MNLTSVDDRIARALANQEVALWLGVGWSWSAASEYTGLLAEQNWLGIWNECRSAELGQFLEKEWRNRPFGRTFVEIPDQVHEALDREFLYSRICPFFYLAGRGPGPDKLSRKGRLLARAAQVEQLDRLGPVYLLIDGSAVVEDLERVLTDDLETGRNRLQRILVTGVPDAPGWLAALNARLPREVMERIDLHPDALGPILARIKYLRETYEQAHEHVLLVGPRKAPVPLTPLLRTDPPIDQYFHVLTGKDLRPAEAEDSGALLGELLSGQELPWRALRHELHWRRPALDQLSQKVLNTLEQMRQRPGAGVVCVDIEGESGSGLTTTLQVLAFRTADHGFPTLMARGGAAVEFDVLRTFLLNLERRLTEQGLPGVPAVVVLDAQECEHDPRHMIELPRRLRRESRRVLLVRGTGNRATLHTPEELQARFQVPPLSRALDGTLLDSLIDDWVKPVYGRHFPERLDEKIDDLRRWAADGEGGPDVPLLACLYLILDGNERLRDKVNLGKHLLDRVTHQLARRHAIAEGSRALRGGVGPALRPAGPPAPATPATDDEWVAAGGTIAVLAGLAMFRQAVPRSVLQSLLDLDLVAAYRLIYLLQESGVVWADLLTDYSVGERAEGRGGRLMPTSYYPDLEPVSLVHALYGRMILDSLAAGTAPFEALRDESPLTAEVLTAFEEMRQPGPQVRLLRPVFRRLQAGVRLHCKYAEELSMQFLRDRYGKGDPDPREILEAHSWLPQAMVEHSGPLLHSRALARKNRPMRGRRMPLAECRQDLQEAVDDLTKALELEEARPGGEDPGTLKTTLGLVYRNWADCELRYPEGELARWREQSYLADGTLREAYELTRSTYPAYALARLLLDRLKRHLGMHENTPEGKACWFPPLSPTELTGLLGEIMVLLSDEPELYYQDQWNETRKETFELLGHDEFARVVRELQARGDEIGFVLQALRTLPPGIGIPRTPVATGEEDWHVREAMDILHVAHDGGLQPTGLGNLMRYALFSALPERSRGNPRYDPAYRQRYHLLQRLADGPGEMYLNDPIWRYDLAMLSFQVGLVGEGVRHFAALRRGRRYALVPITRTADWVKDPDERLPTALIAQLQIVRIDRFNDRGWGRLVDQKLGYREEIPFRISLFTSRAVYGPDMFQVGRKIYCRFHLRPSGPYAVPPEPDREAEEGTQS
jgi:hypothetical protein